MPVTLGVGFDVTGGSAVSRNTPNDVIAAGTAGVDYDVCGPNHLFFYKHLWVNGYWEDTGWTLQFDNGVRCFMGGSGNWLSGYEQKGEHVQGAVIRLENMGTSSSKPWTSANGAQIEWHGVRIEAIGGSRSDFFISDSGSGDFNLYDCLYDGEAISSGGGDCGFNVTSGEITGMKFFKCNFKNGGDVGAEIVGFTGIPTTFTDAYIAVHNAPTAGWPLTLPNFKPALDTKALGVFNSGSPGFTLNLLSLQVPDGWDPSDGNDFRLRHTQFGAGTNTVNFQQKVDITLLDSARASLDAQVLVIAQSDSHEHINTMSTSGSVSDNITAVSGDNDGLTSGGDMVLKNIVDRALCFVRARKKDYQFSELSYDFTVKDFESEIILLDDDSFSASIANEATHTIFTDLDEVYDYGKWWLSESGNISWAAFFSAAGSTIDFGSVNVVIDATAVSVWTYNGTTLTIKATSLGVGSVFDKILTTGTITFANGAEAPGVALEDSTGVATPIDVVNLTSSNVQIEDDLGAVVHRATGLSGTYSYTAPLGSSGTWKLVVDRAGWRRAVFNFQADGSKQTFSGELQEFINPDGTSMYTGSTNALITVTPIGDGSRLNIDIGDGLVTSQEIFDEVEIALTAQVGMEYLGNGGGITQTVDLSTGKFLFMGPNVRLRRANVGDNNASVDAFCISEDGIVIDGVNGDVKYPVEPVKAAILESEMEVIRYLMGMAGTATAPPNTVQLAEKSDVSEFILVTASIPQMMDLANTVPWRFSLILTNMVGDLPTAAEITEGTYEIEKKPLGGTAWNPVTSGACSKLDGLVYFDEVFDAASGYAEGDRLRITFKDQKVTVNSKDFVVSDTNGRIFTTAIHESERGTNGALTTLSGTVDANIIQVNGGAVTLSDFHADLTSVPANVWAAAQATNQTAGSMGYALVLSQDILEGDEFKRDPVGLTPGVYEKRHKVTKNVIVRKDVTIPAANEILLDE